MQHVVCNADSRFNGVTALDAVQKLERENDDLRQEVADLRDMIIRIEERNG